jgi:UDP-glucose 4-epimerase
VRFKGKNVLVTGGAGFVGSNLVSGLISEGAKVTVLDDLFTGELSNLPESGYRFSEGDVCDAKVVRELVRENPLIVHAAARNIIISSKDPFEDYRVNIGGTLNILLAAKEIGIERLVYTSSCSIYGNPRHLPISEDDMLSTLSPYSVSKLAGENYCIAFHESYRLPVSVLRYTNVYGPRQKPSNPYCGVVAKFMSAAMKGEPLQIHGDGQQTRDFSYVDDVVEATLLALLDPRAEGQVFNIGTGFETSVNELAAFVGQALERDVAIEYVDRRDIDNIRRRTVNIEKARRTLRWWPSVSLKNGLAKTIRWFRQKERTTA